MKDTEENHETFNIINELVLTPYEAKIRDRKRIRLEQAAGEISAEYVFLYPPGIPVIVPGERISGDAIKKILKYREQKMNLIGLDEEHIYTVDERV